MAEMENLLNARAIDKALKRLNSRMVYGEVAPVEIVVCGGAALIGSKVMSRSTRDVDNVALAHLRGANIELLGVKLLPVELRRMVAEIWIQLWFLEDCVN